MTVNRLHKWLYLAGLCLASAAAPALFAADDPPPSAGDDPALDALLLETLDAELLKDLDVGQQPKSNRPADAPSPPETKPEEDWSDLDRALLDQLGHGEDLGQENDNPLLSIGRRMRIAENLISQRMTSDRTQRVQRLIVEDLDQLIEQLERACAQAASRAGNKPPKPDAGQGGKTQGGSGENRDAAQPARDSSDRLGTAEVDEAQTARMQEMLKRVWGHLPTRVREQMQSGSIEEFLPKYETLIEAYYSRLAEMED